MKLKRSIFTALLAAMLCLLAPISLPIGGVPMSLSMFGVALVAMLVFMVVIGELGLRSSRVITGFAYECGSFLYWRGLFYIIGRIIINKRLLKDRLRMKEQQLRERDEWRQYLHRMSGGWVMDTMLALAYIAAVTASCCDNKAFYTAFALLTAAALLKLIAEIGYGKGWIHE